MGTAKFNTGGNLDLPQVSLMNFRVEYVRPLFRSRRGRLVSLGFSFAFHAKNEEWRDLQLVFQITFGIP